MAKVSQSSEDLGSHLNDQLEFLRRSSESFDGGFEGEARRLAVSLRILLHDTEKSSSLLGQLGLKDSEFFDSADDWNPKNLVAHHSLIGIQVGGKRGPVSRP